MSRVFCFGRYIGWGIPILFLYFTTDILWMKVSQKHFIKFREQIHRSGPPENILLLQEKATVIGSKQSKIISLMFEQEMNASHSAVQVFSYILLISWILWSYEYIYFDYINFIFFQVTWAMFRLKRQHYFSGVVSSFKRIYHEQGFRAFWRGNQCCRLSRNIA